VGGFIDVCEREGIELLPVVDVEVEASATVSDRTYNFYLDKIREKIEKNACKMDGVLLALHGAMVTEGHFNPELDMIRALKELPGKEIPLGVVFDLHGNLDPAVLNYTDIVCGYHSSPHLDMNETGKRAVRLLIDSLKGKIKPVSVMAKPGIVVPSVFSAATVSPAKELMERKIFWEKHTHILDISVFFGFVWSDVPQIGMSVVAITDNRLEIAEEAAEDIASLAMEKRDALTGRGKFSYYGVSEGVKLAMDKAVKARRPIMILDHADRINDTTFVLEELILRDAQKSAAPGTPPGFITAPVAMIFIYSHQIFGIGVCISVQIHVDMCIDQTGYNGFSRHIDDFPIRWDRNIIFSPYSGYYAIFKYNSALLYRFSAGYVYESGAG